MVRIAAGARALACTCIMSWCLACSSSDPAKSADADAGSSDAAVRDKGQRSDAQRKDDMEPAAPSSESSTPDKASDKPASNTEPQKAKPDSSGSQDPETPPAELPPRPSRGAAVAISNDDRIAVVVNRDTGTVSVIGLEYPDGVVPKLRPIKEVMLGEQAEPYQVALAPDGETAYVVLRRAQKLVKLGSLRGEPAVVGSVATGSEPTAVALSPSGRYAYVANWNDGSVFEYETEGLTRKQSVDLNAALVATGYLGDVKARAALAHPRSLAVSNNGDDRDDDETLYATEYFAQQTEAEQADGSNADTRKVGLVYRVKLSSHAVETVPLSALRDLGFKDNAGAAAGCYPNQLQAIALNGDFAYVLSVCASPKGPLGVKTTTTSCTTVSDCGSLNLVDAACVTPFAGAPSAVCVDVASVKTTTAPVISVIDTRSGREVQDGAHSLNAGFASFYASSKLAEPDQRFPLFANDLAFVLGTSVGYVTANGVDAVFRFQVDAKSGALKAFGSSTQPFIDLGAHLAPEKAGKNPIGIAITASKRVGLVANDVSRNATLVDFNTQSVAGKSDAPVVLQTSALPATGSDADKVLRGKRFFNTGSARWSLRGQGWGACQSCHGDGLSDNVTWYFARGPRQSTSLDGSFASKHPQDQRIFNWTAIFDEVDDFEANTRDISGGVGAIVSDVSMPPVAADRIDFAGLGHAGLNGSSARAGDPANPLMLGAPGKLADWSDITRYIQSIRSPRAPTQLDAQLVAAGKTLFSEQGSCQGCHAGEKWTISSRFYTPAADVSVALKKAPFTLATGFPSALLPATQAANQVLRFGGSMPAAFDQLLCALRPVGTFKVAEDGVGIAELRADMKTVAQGDGDPAGEGRGYNIPSLLGVSTGAPFFHAGNARTLEAAFGSAFETHAHALAPNFLTETDAAARTKNVGALVQYLLSIDEDTAFPALPAPGAGGGSLCPVAFP